MKDNAYDPEFPKNHKIIGKHKNANGQFHFVWGPGRVDANLLKIPKSNLHMMKEMNSMLV